MDEIFLKEIKFLQDFRTFKAGESIKIEKPFLALVGINGCGKSTILDCIREHFGIEDESCLKGDYGKENYEIIKSDIDFKVKYRDFHANDMKYASHFGDDIRTQVIAMRASSGIGSLMQFSSMDLKNFKNGLIVLDEPDRGMSPKTIRDLMGFLLMMVTSNQNQLIISTHSEKFMDLASMMGQIYSVEHKRFFDTKEEFLEEHLKIKKDD